MNELKKYADSPVIFFLGTSLEVIEVQVDVVCAGCCVRICGVAKIPHLIFKDQ